MHNISDYFYETSLVPLFFNNTIRPSKFPPPLLRCTSLFMDSLFFFFAFLFFQHRANWSIEGAESLQASKFGEWKLSIWLYIQMRFNKITVMGKDRRFWMSGEGWKKNRRRRCDIVTNPQNFSWKREEKRTSFFWSSFGDKRDSPRDGREGGVNGNYAANRRIWFFVER